MTRAAIYSRVSTRLQREGYSLAIQEQACRDHAAHRGYDIVAVYCEVESGGIFWERPRLAELRKAARSRQFDVLLAYAVDRVSRDLAHWSVLLDEFQQGAVRIEVITVQAPIDGHGPITSALQALAADERKITRDRTHRGLRERAHEGKLLGGRELYGYRYLDPEKRARARTTLIESEAEAAVVRRIFSVLTAGGTANAIARVLTEQGVPTPKGGREWTPRVIINIVRNPAYKGDAAVFRSKLVKGKAAQPTPESDRISLPTATVPALVDAATWEAANLQIERNRTSPSRHNRHPEKFLLRSGFARCGHCRRPLVATNVHGHRYLCATQNRRLYGCPHTSITAAELDSAV